MGRDDSAKDGLKIPSILNSHCPMRIATNSIYLYKVDIYILKNLMKFYKIYGKTIRTPLKRRSLFRRILEKEKH